METTIIFQYQGTMQTVLSNMASRMIPSIQSVAYVLMVICLLLGIYEAYAKGGDTRQLATTVFKYVVAAFIVGNWTAAFSDTVTGFNQIASAINNSFDGWDLMKEWGNQLSTNWSSSGYNSIWQLITNGGAAIVNSLEIAIAYLIFPIAVQIFTILYAFWGAVLFAVGPLILALTPSRMVNSMAKFYVQHLIVWNCWTVVYAILACLIAAVNGTSVTSSPFFTGSVAGQQAQIMIGLTSILYALCILLIPLIAAFVLKGEFSGVAGALMTLLVAANQTSRLASAGGAASGAGRSGGGAASGSQGGMGGGSYRNLSRPPDNTPPRSTTT